MTYWLIVPPESPCGCESGKLFGDCHLNSNGDIQLIWKDYNPPLPGTGEQIRKCHFAYTNNCGAGISREHIISKAVLKELTEDRIRLQTANFVKELPLNSDALKTKRMCRRHNSAFGVVDREIGRFVRVVQQLPKTLEAQFERPIRAYLFAGFDLERWFLKTLLNLYFSRLSVNPKTFSLPNNIAAAFNSPLPRPYGLYMPFHEIDSDKYRFSIGKHAAFNLTTEGSTVTGITASLAGLDFVFLLAGSLPYMLEFASSHTYRPQNLVFFEGKESVSALIGWSD
ncbi:MAG: hypothetical protein KA447_06755, partial [Pyrinomonadaceae bacterium]|nr:hypothetical protein [Pyrinomonadaceae bacterium]